MKHIQFRKLFEKEFHFKEEKVLTIHIPEVSKDAEWPGWCLLPVMESNVVSQQLYILTHYCIILL